MRSGRKRRGTGRHYPIAADHDVYHHQFRGGAARRDAAATDRLQSTPHHHYRARAALGTGRTVQAAAKAAYPELPACAGHTSPDKTGTQSDGNERTAPPQIAVSHALLI